MIKKVTRVSLLVLPLLFLNGCLHRELVISSPKAQAGNAASSPARQPMQPNNTYAQNSNIPAASSVAPVDSNQPIVTPVGSTVPVTSTAATTQSGYVAPRTNYSGKVARMPFPAQEYAGLVQSGRSTVKGVIYATDTYGKRVYGTHTKLYLNPVTSYSRDWFNKSYIGGASMEKADKRLYNYLKFTQSNSKGQFAFFGIPAGSYYAVGTVKMPSGKSVRIAKQISVGATGTTTVDLSKMAQ